jgi:hypothetical protein
MRKHIRSRVSVSRVVSSLSLSLSLTLSQMVTAGADLNWQDPLGNTALHRAVHKDKFEIAEKLIESGSSLATQNREAKKPLDLAKSPRIRKVNTHRHRHTDSFGHTHTQKRTHARTGTFTHTHMHTHNQTRTRTYTCVHTKHRHAAHT